MQLSERFDEALGFAADRHRKQKRKGTDIPYISHLLGVASIALLYGADEDEAIAALLHDTIEDQGGAKAREEIRQRFGDRVTEIVDACSDTDVEPKPPWRDRKAAYHAHVRSADKSVRLVSAADKLHNVTSMLSDYRQIGDALWGRFVSSEPTSRTESRDDQLWNYQELVKAFKAGESTALTMELERAVGELETAVNA